MLQTRSDDHSRSFFLTTNPGLESVAHLELCSLWGRAPDFFSSLPYPDIQRWKGGVEFQAPLNFGLNLQPWIRSCTRMLLREADFSCEHERDLIKGLQDIPWKNYLSKKSGYSFRFTSKSSRISKKDQIEKVLKKVLKPLGYSFKKEGTAIFIRVFRDQCNISFDCSGEAAFRRGEGKKGSIASLRPSVASALIRMTVQGIKEDFIFIDPMCGAGTLLDEVLMFGKKMGRDFACERFPCFEKLEFSDDPEGSPHAKKVYGFDYSDKALQVASQNLKKHSEPVFELSQADLFNSGKGQLSEEERPRVVITNPPWGKRLPGASQDLLKVLYEKYQPERLGLLIPSHWKMTDIPMEKVRDVPLFNSGVENRFLIFVR